MCTNEILELLDLSYHGMKQDGQSFVHFNVSLTRASSDGILGKHSVKRSTLRDSKTSGGVGFVAVTSFLLIFAFSHNIILPLPALGKT